MFNPKKLFTASLAVILLSTLSPAVFAEEFSDVYNGTSYYVSISYLKENGIIEGYSDNTFKPDNEVNRAEALKMLTLASGIFDEEEMEENELEEQPFADTPLDAWYTPYVAAAKEEGIINGYSDNTFQPDKLINLAETLKIFLTSYSDISYDNTEDYLYVDTPLGEWLTQYTAYAAEKGLINIYSTNTVNPSQEMTRGYLAEIVYRMIMSRDHDYHFGKATYYGSALHGNKTASGDTFDMYAMTAAHKTLPFGTIVRVTNLANGEYIDVEINDRGPYGPGRVIDLSSSAFEEIAALSTGVINVQYKELPAGVTLTSGTIDFPDNPFTCEPKCNP
jgi:rare lipoprotein A (peptidoglycan hydrolase)